MAKIIVVNGVPRSGKDTFAELCCNQLDSSIHWSGILSTVDFVKEVALFCGWDKEKTPKNRKFLSDLKDLLTEWDDIPMKRLDNAIKNIDNGRDNRNALANFYGQERKELEPIVFVMCREPKEIQRIKDKYNALTVLIRREEMERQEQSNHADSEVFNYSYDLTIFNNSDIIDLSKKAKEFLIKLELNLKGDN